jgi:nucleoside-diphosphate-sugar epimerase
MLEVLAEAVDRPSCGPRLPLKPMLLLSAVVEDICAVLKIKPPIYRRRMDFYMNDAAFSSKRAEAVLGWVPRTSLREGLANTVAAYRNAGTIAGTSLSVSSRIAMSLAIHWAATTIGQSLYEGSTFLA